MPLLVRSYGYSNNKQLLLVLLFINAAFISLHLTFYQQVR